MVIWLSGGGALIEGYSVFACLRREEVLIGEGELQARHVLIRAV